jgi:alginate O-acetyltransferase complex protein AlgI
MTSNKIRSKLFLSLCIINNLGILFLFKYYNFFIIQFTNIFNKFVLNFNIQLLSLAIPIGISFYIFHGMSYVIDIYRKERTPINNFIDYALFVSFFPLLVAGPIERAHHLLPQIQQKRNFNYLQIIHGCCLILWRLGKKVVIADTLLIKADTVFNNYHSYNSISLIIAAIGFSFQIYCDFSGYTDIALGSA